MTDERRNGDDRRKAPAFSFYVKDWLSSERVALMSGCAEGLYVRLLALCWDNESLPADERALRALVPKHRQCWKRCWPQVAPCFERKGARLYHRKLETQRSRLQELSATRAENGRMGGLARSNSQANAKHPPSLAVAVASAVATSKPSAPRKSKAESTEPWLAPFAHAWEARFQGTTPWGRIGTALKPLREKYPDAEILVRWQRFLAQARAGVNPPEQFAQTFGDWAPTPVSVPRVTRDVAIRWALNVLPSLDEKRIPRDGFATDADFQAWLAKEQERQAAA